MLVYCLQKFSLMISNFHFVLGASVEIHEFVNEPSLLEDGGGRVLPRLIQFRVGDEIVHVFLRLRQLQLATNHSN